MDSKIPPPIDQQPPDYQVPYQQHPTPEGAYRQPAAPQAIPQGQEKPSQTLGVERDHARSNEWNNSIWDCFSGPDNLCLKATFCSCFVYGKTVARTRDPSLLGYKRINNDCLIWSGLQFCCGLGFVMHLLNRQEVRNRYAIEGNQIEDALLSFCCQCCSLIQVEKELIARESQQLTGLPTGYIAPQGMVAGPQ